MMKDFSIKKSTSLKSRFKIGKNREKPVDVNSNVAYTAVEQGEEAKKDEKLRRFSAPSKNENISPPLKQFAKVLNSRIHKEPEIIHNYKTFRLLILGASGVGKTSILERFVNGSFFQLHIQTVSEVYETGIFLNYDDQLKQFDLEFRDFNGDFKVGYPDLYEQQIMEAHACIVVYSKDIPESIDMAVETIGDVKNLKDNNAPILVIENKTDLHITSNKTITAETFSLDNCICESTSSKLNENIETAIHKFIRAIEDQT